MSLYRNATCATEPLSPTEPVLPGARCGYRVRDAPGCVIDGEAVVWSQDRLDFSALQQRLGAGPKTLPGLVRETPASYAAFDVMAVAGHDARELPLSRRRALLEELASGWKPLLSPLPHHHGPRRGGSVV